MIEENIEKLIELLNLINKFQESAYLFLFGVGSLLTELFAVDEIVFKLISYQ